MNGLSIAVGGSCFANVDLIVVSTDVLSWGSTCVDGTRKLSLSGQSWRENEVSEILEKEASGANSNVDCSVVFACDFCGAIIG